MKPSRIVEFDASSVAGETVFVAADKLVSGNRRQMLRNHYTDPSGRFSAGVWASEPGSWRVAYTEEEYCQILEGVSVITDDQGHAVTVRAGESFVIPSGFVGTWEVVQPTKKIYVVYEAGGKGP